MRKETIQKQYWRANIRLLIVLSSIWFVTSFGLGMWFSNFLDQFRLGGFPLGFWSAQLLSIIMLIVLVFVYVARINRLDKKLDLEE